MAGGLSPLCPWAGRRCYGRAMASPDVPAPLPRLPVVALVLSVVGLCLPPVLLVTGGLSLYALWRARGDAAWAARKPLAQMTAAVSGAGLLIFLAMGLPNIKRFQLRMKQQACREGLTALLAAETRFHQRASRYTTSLSELDVRLERGPYLYRLAAEGPVWRAGELEPAHVGLGPDELRFGAADALEAGLPSLLRETLGVHGACPGCAVTLACVGNLDGDATLDLWSISSKERPGARGETIPAGLAWNHRDDVTE